MLEYASRLEKGSSAVPELRDTKSTPSSSVASLEMGWALKQSRSRNTRFTDKKKDYLIVKFQTGEQTVSRLMRSQKDENGEQLLDCSEFFTSRRISSFFSRLASKRSLDHQEVNQSDDDEQIRVEKVSQLQAMRKKVVFEISIQHAHPILCNDYSIYELVKNSKLSNFSIKELNDICTSFGLDTSQVNVKRKKPYVDTLTSLVMGCQCQANGE